MTELKSLKQFNQVFNDVKNSLNNYNDNLRNELFEKEPNEDNEQAYKRGETIFDQCEEDIRNLTEIVIGVRLIFLNLYRNIIVSML